MMKKTIHYRKYCKVLADVIKLAKGKYYDNLLSNSTNRTKTTWNIINENINREPRENDISAININGIITHNSRAIANTFNDYFSTVAQHIITENYNNSDSAADKHSPLDYLHNAFRQPFPSVKLNFVSHKETVDDVSTLTTKASHGYDEISTKLIKQCISYISSPLTYIPVCNLMISSGVFPTRLKFAEIKPLYKKCDMMDLTNYRPISLLSSFSKISEKIIFRRLTRHLNCNGILAKEEFGFRNKSSTGLASYKLINDILTSLNNKLLVGGIFCDLQKVFDCVDHDLLLAKMLWYGVLDKGHKLIKSYLENRYQRVIITNNARQYYSEWEPVKYGVPQGSILSPLLFIMHINDLPETIVISADDTSMIVTISISSKFVNNINKWFKSNSLSLNIDKTYFLQFNVKSNNVNDLRVLPEDKQIGEVQTIKFLGLKIDSILSWRQHIDSIIPKLNKACFAIRLVKPFMSLEVTRAIYFAYFHTVLSCGIIFWGNSVHRKHIFKIQKRIIRLITNSGIRDSCRDLFKILEILPFYSQYLYSLLTLVAKHRDLFKANADFHSISMSYNSDLHLPSAQLKLFQKAVLYSGIKAYNHLPLSIKELLSDVKRFKPNLKKFFNYTPSILWNNTLKLSCK